MGMINVIWPNKEKSPSTILLFIKQSSGNRVRYEGREKVKESFLPRRLLRSSQISPARYTLPVTLQAIHHHNCCHHLLLLTRPHHHHLMLMIQHHHQHLMVYLNDLLKHIDQLNKLRSWLTHFPLIKLNANSVAHLEDCQTNITAATKALQLATIHLSGARSVNQDESLTELLSDL